jgi:hypothetical protein
MPAFAKLTDVEQGESDNLEKTVDDKAPKKDQSQDSAPKTYKVEEAPWEKSKPEIKPPFDPDKYFKETVELQKIDEAEYPVAAEVGTTEYIKSFVEEQCHENRPKKLSKKCEAKYDKLVNEKLRDFYSSFDFNKLNQWAASHPNGLTVMVLEKKAKELNEEYIQERDSYPVFTEFFHDKTFLPKFMKKVCKQSQTKFIGKECDKKIVETFLARLQEQYPKADGDKLSLWA